MEQNQALFAGTTAANTISDLRTYAFIKEHGRWYIDLPEYLESGGKKEDLDMEGGADDLLHFLARGKNKVVVRLDTEPFPGCESLTLIAHCDTPRGGAYYLMANCRGKAVNKKMWLRDISLFVFGDMPEIIFVKNIKQYTNL